MRCCNHIPMVHVFSPRYNSIQRPGWVLEGSASKLLTAFVAKIGLYLHHMMTKSHDLWLVGKLRSNHFKCISAYISIFSLSRDIHQTLDKSKTCQCFWKSLDDLSKPLLMRMSELERVCIEEQVPSHEVKVAQRMNEHVPGVICHSASPTGIGQFINSIKCLVVKDYRSPDKGGHNMSVVSHLHTKHCESDAGDIGTLFMSPKNRSGELLSENPIRM